MVKNIRLKLINLHYGGDSVGDDIRLEVQLLGQIFKLDRQIRNGDTIVFNQEAVRFGMTENNLETDIAVKIIEKDFLFNDVGQSAKKLTISPASLPQEFNIEVKVQERRITLGKSTAIFSLNFVMETLEQETKVKPYNTGPHGEDYNKYDNYIEAAVNDWNKIFSQQQEGPPVLLDANLIKAMAYVESHLGYFQPKSGYSGYPDIMQVADPRNDAIYALKNIYNPKWKKKATEYEVINNKLTRLQYSEATGEKPEESIKWGVRWLYHVAQKNIKKENLWSREWKSWKDAVYWYNTGGDPEYVKKVYNAYEQGQGDSGYKLWAILLALMVVGSLIYGGIYMGLTVHDKYSNAKDSSLQGQVAGIAIAADKGLNKNIRAEQPTDQNYASSNNSKPFDGYGDVSVLRQENYPPANCVSNNSKWESEEVLKNCTYTIGTNWSPLWTVSLRDGEYSYASKNSFISVRDQTNSPSYVAFEHYTVGDLTHDGLDDAVVVLRVNYGGTGNWLNMIVLVQESSGQYKQVANYMMEDREAIRGINIDNGIITAQVIVKADDDPQCCASIYGTYRFKIADSKMTNG